MSQENIEILAGVLFILIAGLIIKLFLFFRKEEKNVTVKVIKFPELNNFPSIKKVEIIDEGIPKKKDLKKDESNDFKIIKPLPKDFFEENNKLINNISTNLPNNTKQDTLEIENKIQTPSYPQIFIPDTFLKIKSLTFEQCKFNCDDFADFNPPKLYQKKTIQTPIYLSEPRYQKFDSEKYKPFFVVLIAILIAIGFFMNIQSLFGFAMLFGFFLFLGLYKIIVVPIMYLNYRIALKDYKQKAPANKILWESYYKEEGKESSIYYSSEKKRENYIQEFKNNLSEDRKNKIIESNIISRKKDFFQSIRTPDHSYSKLKRGFSEDKFRNCLNIGLGNILNDQCINGYYTNPDYHPDFVYKDPDGFYIDIEIDEPYTKSEYSEDFIPIHFFSEKNNASVDNDRNQLFLKNNWFVIRFSEKQVIQNHLQCIFCIRELISFIKGNNVGEFSLSNNSINEKMWTAREAIEMSKKNYRSSYINPLSSDIILKNLGIDL